MLYHPKEDDDMDDEYNKRMDTYNFYLNVGWWLELLLIALFVIVAFTAGILLS
jgi:hypothetical protein